MPFEYNKVSEEGCFDNETDIALLVRCHGYEGGFPVWWRDPICFRDFRLSELRKFLPRLCVAGIYMFAAVYANNLSMVWLQQHMHGFYESRAPSSNRTSVLFDLGFQHLPHLGTSYYADSWIFWTDTLNKLRFFILPGPLSMRWTGMQRWLVIFGTLFFLRAICIIVTPLPNPYTQCVPHLTYPDNMWLQALTFFHKPDYTCQDVLFSGHAVTGGCGTLFVAGYLWVAPWSPGFFSQSLINLFAIVWLALGCFVIVASHYHYSVDVYVGLLLTCIVMKLYHHHIKLTRLYTSRWGSFTWFVNWFEEHAVDLKYWEESTLKNFMHSATPGIKFASAAADEVPAGLVRTIAGTPLVGQGGDVDV